MDKCHIGQMKYVSVNSFGGRLGVHIRQYEKNLMGKEFPTRKGVCLGLGAYAELMNLENLINRTVTAARENISKVYMQKHIGNGFVITVDGESNSIDFRRYFLPDGATFPVPTRVGIYIKMFAWESLRDALKECSNQCDELKNAMPCNCIGIQGNQMFECPECRPFGLNGFNFNK